MTKQVRCQILKQAGLQGFSESLGWVLEEKGLRGQVGCKSLRKNRSGIAPRLSLTSYESCIKTSCNRNFRGSFNDRAAVGKQGHLIRIFPEFQDKLVVPDGTVRLQSLADSGEIEWPCVFMNLDGIAPAQGNVGTSFAREMNKFSPPASSTIEVRFGGRDFRTFVGPKIMRNQGSAQMFSVADQQLDGFGCRDGC